MQYWLEDYESGEISIHPFMDEIIRKCKKIIDDKKLVRIGYVILEDMKLEFSKYDLLQVLAHLEETGKYQSKYIKRTNGMDDFIVTKVPKKPLAQRYWVFTEAIKYAIGFGLGVLTKTYL